MMILTCEVRSSILFIRTMDLRDEKNSPQKKRLTEDMVRSSSRFILENLALPARNKCVLVNPFNPVPRIGR